VVTYNGDGWRFNPKSERVNVLLVPRSSTPFHRVLEYGLKGIHYEVLYNTTLYRPNTRRLGWDGFYKRYMITVFLLIHRGSKNLLYDTTQGTFPGRVILPKKDRCKRYRPILEIRDIGVVYCTPFRMRVVLTVYDLKESNTSNGSFEVHLINGVRLHPGIKDVTGVPVKDGFTCLKRVYTNTPILVIDAYLKRNNYSRVWRGLIKGFEHFQDITPRSNTYYDQVLLFVFQLKGVKVVGIEPNYEPRHGLIKNGSGASLLTEIPIQLNVGPSFKKDKNSRNFRISDTDGSIWHFVDSKSTKTARVKEKLIAVDVFNAF
jgi:hypothetical protein